MGERERLQAIESEWEAIESSYRLMPYLTPLNLTQERERTLVALRRGEPYNPRFVYPPLPDDLPLARLHAFRHLLRPTKNPIEELYETLAREEVETIESIRLRTPEALTEAASRTYGKPDDLLLAEAWKILNEVPAPSAATEPMVDAETAAATMQQVLNELGLVWRVEVHEPMQAQMSVERLDHRVRIRRGIHFTKQALQRLIVHEIGVHVLRAENGARQPVRLFFSGLPGFMATEEGLALHSEAHAGLLEAATLRKYAARVVAAHESLRGSFSAVCALLVPLIGAETTFDVVTRSKRGFADTAQPGAHTKDIVYLRGYLEVRAYLQQHPADHALLFGGKFALHHLPLVRSLQGQQLFEEPRYLPEQLLPYLDKFVG